MNYGNRSRYKAPQTSRNSESTTASSDLIKVDDLCEGIPQNDRALLDLSDCVRASLQESKTTGPKMDEVRAFIGDTLKQEYEGRSTIHLTTIRNARLDKLLDEILAIENRAGPTPIEVRADVAIARSLQRQWRTRYRESYFDLDQSRYTELPCAGPLRAVVFDDKGGNDVRLWRPESHASISELGGDLQYEIGHWWLNLACANRDGIVGSILEIPTTGAYGVATLPLLKGREESDPMTGTIRYTREGAPTDMHVSLICRVGFQVRILRGHLLQSSYAPVAGVRYDGLYIIRQYSQRRNQHTGLHKVVLTLDRVPGQRAMRSIMKIPRPSQLDDWRLFERYEGEMVQRRRGEQDFLDWKLAKAQQKIDQNQRIRTMGLCVDVDIDNPF